MEDQQTVPKKESEILAEESAHLKQMAADIDIASDETIKAIMISYNDKVTNAHFEKADRASLVPAIAIITKVIRAKAAVIDGQVKLALKKESNLKS